MGGMVGTPSIVGSVGMGGIVGINVASSGDSVAGRGVTGAASTVFVAVAVGVFVAVAVGVEVDVSVGSAVNVGIWVASTVSVADGSDGASGSSVGVAVS